LYGSHITAGCRRPFVFWLGNNCRYLHATLQRCARMVKYKRGSPRSRAPSWHRGVHVTHFDPHVSTDRVRLYQFNLRNKNSHPPWPVAVWSVEAVHGAHLSYSGVILNSHKLLRRHTHRCQITRTQHYLEQFHRITFPQSSAAAGGRARAEPINARPWPRHESTHHAATPTHHCRVCIRAGWHQFTTA